MGSSPVLSGCGVGRYARRLGDHRLTVHWDRRIEVEDRGDAILQPVADTGDDHATLGVTAQVHAACFLGLDHGDDVRDVGVQADARLHQVGPLAVAGQGRRQHARPGRLQRPTVPQMKQSFDFQFAPMAPRLG